MNRQPDVTKATLQLNLSINAVVNGPTINEQRNENVCFLNIKKKKKGGIQRHITSFDFRYVERILSFQSNRNLRR